MCSTIEQSSRRDSAGWRGRVLLWEDFGLFIGNAGLAELHESPAIKVCIALDGQFGLRSADGQTWRDHVAALVPAGVRHAIRGNGVAMAMLLIAPEGEFGRMLFGSANTDHIVPIDNDPVPRLREAFSGLSGDEAASTTAMRSAVEMIASMSAGQGRHDIDPRVLQSIEWIRAGRESGILVKDIAAEVDLSESRFSHLFSEHVRVPVRRYLLWLRLRDVLHLLASTGSLTEAAHEAGFADSAHLSRTFRSALGIAPTDLTRESSLTSFLR